VAFLLDEKKREESIMHLAWGRVVLRPSGKRGEGNEPREMREEEAT